ncbi:MAG: NADH-quinone oxidoreductase subunit J [Candidatus Goldbacteria bacterium]|nr:NADH-quinone oxidoreductase subunit J [Candidatus Goldiibacteriota bacterium]
MNEIIELLVLIILSIILIIQILILFSKNIITIVAYTFLIFLFSATIFALMGFKFLAILYLITYTGAIIILFLISIKIIQPTVYKQKLSKRFLPFLISIIFSALIFIIFKHIKLNDIITQNNNINYLTLTDIIFNKNFILVEIISLMLIAAIIGTVNYLKKEN